jgi:hypothetical protein
MDVEILMCTQKRVFEELSICTSICTAYTALTQMGQLLRTTKAMCNGGGWKFLGGHTYK